MPLLSREQIAHELASLDGWRAEHDAIVRQYAFANFPAAVAFVNRLVAGAEAADHHPDITINYRRVTLSYSTHSKGGVTEKDFAGARLADACAREAPPGAGALPD